ncbi:MAG TPA: CIA30 family protein [Polyangiaceae bacterium]
MMPNKIHQALLLLFAVFLAAYGCQVEKAAPPPSTQAQAQAAPAKPRAKPNKIILGYSYTGNDAKWAPADYDYSEVTHITRCFLMFQEDGTMTDGGIFDPKLTELAKKHGVKLMASIGGWAGGQFDHTWYKMARDPKARQRFFDSLDKIITSHGYDGIDIDWEPLVRDELKEPEQLANQKTFAEFMVALRQRFPKWIISTAIGAGPNTFKHVSWPEVVASVDYINLMAYDLAGSWTKRAAHNANLFPTSDFMNKDDLDVDASVKLLLEKYKVAPSKLLLGVPFYGKQFSTDKINQTVAAGAIHPGEQIDYTAVAPLAESGDYRRLWDKGAHIPYLERISGGHTVSYDDEKAITEKCNYAREKGLAGVFTWSLGTDLYRGRPVLLDAMAHAMGVPPGDPPVDFLKKYYETRISDAKKLSQEIVKAQGELVRLDKGKEHKTWDPLQAFIGMGTTKSDRKALEAQIEKAEKLVYKLKSKMEEVDAKLDALPLSYRAGRPVKSEAPALLVADFEDGTINHKLGGSWESEFDQNKLGTTMNPSPLKLTPGGYKGSKNCLRMWGHFGKSGAPPWPYADVGASMPTSDLSQFKAIRFAAKGNAKKYMVVLRRGAVRDYGQFRAPFSAPKEWTQVEVKFDELQQPDWAHPVQRGWVDVIQIAFMPDVLFSDEDYDLSIDNVELVK